MYPNPPQDLTLWRTQVTDTGMKELCDLESLETLDVRETKVTESGVKILYRALPMLLIDSGSGDG